jgi:nitrate/TMAO reductase-like tetraheme cytochrome c subunit
MRRILVFSCLSATLVLAYCSTSKKAQRTTPNATKVTYANNVQPIIAASCSPCHIPPEGKKKPLNSYADVKSNINEILTRVQKNPDEKGFMPARHPKLSDSTIMVLKQWQADGTPQE